MYRDFIYLDINRVQSIIAQLQEGLLDQILEGETKQTTGGMRMAMNLLAMLIPVSASSSLEHSSGSSLSESRVLHDYAFETARRSLEDEGILLERDDLDWDEVPESGFVLVRGAAQILDFETYRDIAGNVERIDKFLGTGKTSEQKRQSRVIKESKVMFDTFYHDAIRMQIVNPQGSRFSGPLIREHLRDDIQSLIYKHGTKPKSEWNMLSEITGKPMPGDSSEDPVEEPEAAGDSASEQINQIVAMLNSFQEYIGSVSYPDIAVSPVAVYREVNP